MVGQGTPYAASEDLSVVVRCRVVGRGCMATIDVTLPSERRLPISPGRVNAAKAQANGPGAAERSAEEKMRSFAAGFGTVGASSPHQA